MEHNKKCCVLTKQSDRGGETERGGERRTQERGGQERGWEEAWAREGGAGPTQASAASDWKPRSVVGGSHLLHQSGNAPLLLHMSTAGLHLKLRQPVVRGSAIVGFGAL